MPVRDAWIPVRLGWSSPFARWQGPLADLSSLDLAVVVTGRALADRGLQVTEVSQLVLGWTVPQPEIFYGATTVAARLGAHQPLEHLRAAIRGGAVGAEPGQGRILLDEPGVGVQDVGHLAMETHADVVAKPWVPRQDAGRGCRMPGPTWP